MAVRTWVGHFCMVDGRVEEEGPWLGALVRQRPDDDPDELHILVEPANAASREFTTQLVDVVAQLYQRDPLSLTGALQRSLRAAHDHLRDWNRRSLREHWVGAGASCVALRGNEAYVAQAGPALVYVRSAAGELRRIEPVECSFEHSLGVAERLDLHLARVTLSPGDMVLLASTRLAAIATDEHVARMLEGGEDALAELYLLCRDEPDMGVVLLSCFEEPSAPPDFLTREGATAPQADDEVPPSATAPALAGVATGQGPRASVAQGAIGAFDAPRRPVQEEVRELSAAAAPPPAAGIRLRGDEAGPRYRRATGAAPVPRIHVPRLAVFGALAILAIGLVAWCQFPRSLKESREERFATLLLDAREANARALAASDPGLKRQSLTDAKTSLDGAAKIHGDNGELLALRADVDAALGVLDAVREVKDFTPVADLAQVVTGDLAVTRVVLGGADAYLLDAKGNRVLRLPLDGSRAPETIAAEGAFAGALQMGRPVAIAWAQQTGMLVILDDRRQAISFFPDGGALPATIRGTGDWGSLDDIDAAGGNLYVLDVDGGQVWRYLPGNNGFDSERTGLLSGVDLGNATELAVAEDIYVLDTKAGIRRFADRQETSFPLAGIDHPLVSPSSLSVLPGSNRIVVADRGNKRIVMASAQGVFLRQIVSSAFTDLRSAVVDEGTSTLYVLNGDTLLRAPLPP